MKDIIVFDWSGTLVDNFSSYEKVIAQMFRRLGKQPISTEELRRNFTLPYMKFWNKYFPNLEKEKQDELFKECTKGKTLCKTYEGVDSVLKFLSQHAYSLYVVSSDNKDDLIREVDYNKLGHYFRDIYGSVYEKSKILGQIKQEHGDLMYVGDTSGDIEEGKKAGVKTIGISWGFQAREIIENSNPDFLIDDIQEIKDILNPGGMHPGE